MAANVGTHSAVRPNLSTSIITAAFLTAGLVLASTCAGQTREDPRPETREATRPETGQETRDETRAAGITYVNRTGEVVDQFVQGPPTNPPTPAKYVRSLNPDESWTDGPTRVSPLVWRLKSGDEVEVKQETLPTGEMSFALVKAEPAPTKTTRDPGTHTKAPTTKASNVLDVPLYAQQTSMWCWATSAEMIMKFHGEDVPQCRQANEYYTKNPKIDFTSWGINCCDFLKNDTTVDKRIVLGGLPQWEDYGFTFKDRWVNKGDSPLTFDEIKAQIDANQPIGYGVFWKSASGNPPGAGHYMVLTGYKTFMGKPMVKIHDPWPSNVNKLSTTKNQAKLIPYSEWLESTKYTHALDQYDIKKK